MYKEVRMGVRQGGGPPPGYKWNGEFLKLASMEGRRELEVDQYRHVVEQFWDLLREDDPTHSQSCSIDAVEDFFELRDKGGPLGRKNVRVFFFLHKRTRTLVVLGVIVKQNNGPTPLADRIRMRKRKRKYLDDYG
jgi:hypothetical protein